LETQLKPRHLQIIQFIISGNFNTLASYILYIPLLHFIHYQIAYLIDIFLV